MRIAGGAPQRIGAGGTEAKLRDVRLAHDDCALALQVGDDELVRSRDIVIVEMRAIGGGKASYVIHVLDANRQPVQGPQLIAAHQGVFRGPRLAQSFFWPHVAEGHEQWIEPLDPLKIMPHHLHGRQGAGPDDMPQFDGRQFVNFRHEFQKTFNVDRLLIVNKMNVKTSA